MQSASGWTLHAHTEPWVRLTPDHGLIAVTIVAVTRTRRSPTSGARAFSSFPPSPARLPSSLCNTTTTDDDITYHHRHSIPPSFPPTLRLSNDEARTRHQRIHSSASALGIRTVPCFSSAPRICHRAEDIKLSGEEDGEGHLTQEVDQLDA